MSSKKKGMLNQMREANSFKAPKLKLVDLVPVNISLSKALHIPETLTTEQTVALFETPVVMHSTFQEIKPKERPDAD